MMQRVLDQEPDTIALIPEFPEFVVIGTYSLVSANNNGGPSVRCGSVRILPFWKSDESSAVTLDCKMFDHGVYDLNFHPRFRNILGIATSNGQVMIYRVQPAMDQHERLQCLTLQEVGTVAAEKNEESGTADMIVTQIQFIDSGLEKSSMHLGHLVVLAMVTTQSGDTNLIEIGISITDDSRFELDHSYTRWRNIHKQSYNLEAWTVLPISVNTIPESRHAESGQRGMIAISGGDDSQLLVSHLEFTTTPSISVTKNHPEYANMEDVVCYRLATDRRTHRAGIVSTCLLNADFPEFKVLLGNSYMFLTGSYDETIRLFQFEPPQIAGESCDLNFLSEFTMPGGVWRILLLDSYRNANGFDCILLIAGHTAGALIVRLTCTPLKDNFHGALESWHYSWRIETRFTQHQSLVYAVAARGKKQHRSMWQLISTSFYDKLICEWEWEDHEWRSQFSTV